MVEVDGSGTTPYPINLTQPVPDYPSSKDNIYNTSEKKKTIKARL